MTSSLPTVSVVIPLYNAADVIGATLRSVFEQTWTDYEILVVDDGSTDGSGAVVAAFGDRISYLFQENRGVAAARNRGIAAARGRYIALLDHDDLWHPSKLEKQVGLLQEREEVGMVITDVAHIDAEGRPMGVIGRGYNPNEQFACLFVRGYVPTPSSAMIRAAVFDSIGGFDVSFHSAGLDDHELWTRIGARYEIVNISEPLTFHRNLGAKPPEIAIRHRAVLISKLLERHGKDPEKRRYLLREQAAYLADLGKHLVSQGRRAEGRAHLLGGLRLSLGAAWSPKTAWRCTSRIARSLL